MLNHVVVVTHLSSQGSFIQIVFGLRRSRPFRPVMGLIVGNCLVRIAVMGFQSFLGNLESAFAAFLRRFVRGYSELCLDPFAVFTPGSYVNGLE